MWVEDMVVLPHNHGRWFGRRRFEWAVFAALAVARPAAACDVWMGARRRRRERRRTS